MEDLFNMDDGFTEDEIKKMVNLEKSYRKIIADMEERIKNHEDLEYARQEFLKLMVLFFSEIEFLKKHYNEKINELMEKQEYLTERLEEVEEVAKNIEEEMALNEEIEDQMIKELIHPELKNFENEIDTECELTCPYCGELFFTYIEGDEKEISCPYCSNPIELDWNDSQDNDKENNNNN